MDYVVSFIIGGLICAAVPMYVDRLRKVEGREVIPL